MQIHLAHILLSGFEKGCVVHTPFGKHAAKWSKKGYVVGTHGAKWARKGPVEERKAAYGLDSTPFMDGNISKPRSIHNKVLISELHFNPPRILRVVFFFSFFGKIRVVFETNSNLKDLQNTFSFV